MKSPYSQAQLAAGKVKQGIARLADKYPFHTKILERFRVVAEPSVGTMGVTVSGKSVLLLIHPDYVQKLPVDELGGVLLHEVHHILFGHLTIDPSDYPDRWALTIALELSVNEFVKEPLPAGAVTLEQFPGLPGMESSKQRYERLRQVDAPFGIDSHSLTGVPGGDLGGAIDNGDGDPGEVSDPAGEAGGDPSGAIDNHAIWQEALQDPKATQRVLAELIQEAALEAGGIPQELLDAIRAVGTTPGNGVHVVQGDVQGHLDWKVLLRRYVGQVLQPRPVFYRPPRRFPDFVGILPGRHRRADQAAVLAIIDTSGSISDQALEEIDGELAKLARTRPVHIVECDRIIHRVYRYRNRLKDLQGRGGTDFRPPLKREFLRSLKANLIIYFTDGFGEAPVKPPSIPLIWCLVPGGEPPAPWGRVLKMEDEGEK